MTRRERVYKAFRHEEADIVPYHLDFSMRQHERMAEHLQDNRFEEKTGAHLHYFQYIGWPESIGNELYKDSFGVTWDRSGADKDIGVVRQPVIEDVDDHTYRIPELDELRLRRDLDILMTSRGDRFTMAAIGFSLFERFWSLCGMENALAAMVTSPRRVEALMEDICAHNLCILDIFLEYDIDGVLFGDDWGQQKGLIMGASYWRKWIRPYLKRMYDKVKAKGKIVLQHSCGDISEILPDLIDLGLDCYQTFQPEIYDCAACKAAYGHHLSFWGGISTQRLLPFASPREVAEETSRMLETMGKGGGYIAAPTHVIPGDVPPENIVAMLEVFQHQKVN